MKASKSIRRAIAVLVIIMITLTAASSAFAAGANIFTKAQAEVRTRAYRSGNEVNIDVSIVNANVNEVASGRIEIYYDSNLLSYASYAVGAASSGAFLIANTTVPGTFAATVCAATPIADGTLFTITLNRAPGATGTAYFGIKVVELIKVDSVTNVPFTAYGCSVELADVSYVVTFMDGYDSSLISSQTVLSGDNAVLPTPPVHAGYVFSGWSSNGVNIIANTVIVANYTQLSGDNVSEFTAVPYFDNGVVCVDVTVAKAAANRASAGVLSLGFNTSLLTYNTYTLGAGSAGALAVVNTDTAGVVKFTFAKAGIIADGIVFTLKFDRTGSQGNASFDLNCSELIYEDGTTILPAVAHDATLYIGNQRFTVTIVDGATGDTLSVQNVMYGYDAVLPTAPIHAGYTFTGWSSNGKGIVTDTTIEAQYECDVLPGDVNGDTRVNSGDAVALLKLVASTSSFTSEQIAVCDFNGDGRVNTGDAVAILRYVAGL